MKKTSTVIAACFMGLMAQAQLIDDFSTAGLGEYTQTRILDNAISEANIAFSDATGSLGAAYGGTLNAAEQVVFLRTDYSLTVGNTLWVDVLFPTQASQMDFGIAVSATASPSSGADTRGTFNWAGVYVRPSQNAVRCTSSINGTVTTSAGVLTADETTVSKLFIQRVTSTQFILGYVNASAVSFTNATLNFTATDVGTAIGFYADLRATTDTLGMLDNLTISPIPEPSTLALCGMGFLGMIAVMRRKK